MSAFDYKPNQKVLMRLKRVTFVAVVGPTAVGKSTLIRAAMARQPQVHLVMNNTSRPPRNSEQEGQEFYFRTRAAMEARIKRGEYAQVAPSVFGDLYATAPEDYATTGVAALPVLAVAVPMFRALPFRQVRCVFIVPPSWEEWQARVQQHGFAPEKVAARLHEAETSLQFALQDPAAQLIINHNLATATADFIRLALGRPLSPRLQADQVRGRELATKLLVRLRARPQSL
jgi:guanylate kinase